MQKILLLSLAGACGTISRYGLCQLASRIKIIPIPLGTLAVNILGSFLFGIVYILAERKLAINPEMRFILLVGFMGAFTTFSTFAFETAKLLRTSDWLLAAGNIFAHTGLGIGALIIGVILAKNI